MSDLSLLAVLNVSNNFTQTVTLTSPINHEYVKFISNRQALIKVSFLADAYKFNATTRKLDTVGGLALAGSKIIYKVTDQSIYRATISLEETITPETEEIQIVCYFFD